MIVPLAGLAVGLIAGLVMRSRWALLLAPLAYVVAIELARRGLAGPTVGAIRLDETFGILALILGRGFHGLVGLLPMLIAAELGVRWRGTCPANRPGRAARSAGRRRRSPEWR